MSDGVIVKFYQKKKVIYTVGSPKKFGKIALWDVDALWSCAVFEGKDKLKWDMVEVILPRDAYRCTGPYVLTMVLQDQCKEYEATLIPKKRS